MFGEVRLPLFEYTDFHQTNSDLYIFGYTAVEKTGKLLRISRTTVKELEVHSDDRDYTIPEYEKELKRIQASNANLQPVCKAYGILGCFRFLAGHYLLVLTARQFVGSICGHGLFAVKDVQLIPLPHGHTRASGREQQAERRYRKLITSGLDLSKDFLVSYSYNLCHTLQTNLTKPLSDPFASRFVWNEYLTRDFRPKVSTQWVLPLIHGYLEQKVLSVFGAPVQFTLIARRSRFFAGTRWRKRGINGLGHVANDVETEQIVQTGRDGATRRPLLSSMVQMRGSIPLYWFQEATGALLSMKPSIKLPPLDPLFDSTTLHFDDLSERYGDPVVVLNLVKMHERVKQESVLGEEFRNAVQVLNEKMRDPRHAIVYHTFDFTYVFKRKGFEHVYPELKPLLDRTYRLTGVFVFNPHGRRHRYGNGAGNGAAGSAEDITAGRDSATRHALHRGALARSQGPGGVADSTSANGQQARSEVHLRLQKGLLRTNCIDCLDRTNVAQCIYGLQVLGVQLQELDLSDESEVDFGSSMAMEIMSMYERMGNCLAMQYGGSQAHSQYFHRQRGDWNAKVQSRDLVTTLTRIYNNNLNDAEKQQAMNLFLGNFVPQPGKPAVWELGSDKHLHAGPSSSPLHYDSRAMLQEVESDEDGAESDGERSLPSSVPPAAAPLPGAATLAGAPSGDLASLTSGSLCDLDAALDVGADSAQRLRDASLSESQALALEVTSKVDGILAQCSDLDRAVKEVDLGVDEEPLSGVHSKRVTWSLARMPMFRGQQRSEPKAAKLHSFDALRSAPQGCPVSVRMHRDMAARSQSQPLLNFFRNALGLSQRQPGPRSPRDQSHGLDGRSEVSRDLSTTHALSRTLSFLSCGVSENISPTAAHSHTSTFVTHASGHADELLSTRTGHEPAASTGVPGLPRTRIAGLPLFLHADVAAVPKALPGVPSAATLRGRLGAESIPDPLPNQAAGRWRGMLSTRSSTRGIRHSATEVIRTDSPSMDMSGHLSGDSATNIASAPLLGGSPQITMVPHGSHHGGHPPSMSPAGHSRPRRQRTDAEPLTSAFQAAGGFAALQRQSSAHGNLSGKMAAMPRSRTVGSSPGALSSSFADVGLEGEASVYTQVMEHMRMRHAEGFDTVASGALSDIPESCEVARLLIPGAASLMPVVDEMYLRKVSAPGGQRGHGSSVPPLLHEDPVSRGLQETLRTWVHQDGKMGRAAPGSGTASPGLGDAMRSSISPLPSSELRMGAAMLARANVPAEGVADSYRESADTTTLADAWRGAELSLVSETAALENEFQRWLDQYTAVFMDPGEEARLVEEYTHLYGSQGYPAQPILPHVL